MNVRVPARATVVLFVCCVLVLAPSLGVAVPYQTPPVNRTSNCHYGVSLEWTTRVGSSVFATPVVADLMHDGKREILIPTFSQFFEAVNGATGEDVPGYPFVHPKFKSYASPMPVDIDGDGRIEWLLAMYSGELILFNEEGRARGLLKVPPLAVKREWFKQRHGSATTLDALAAMRVSAPSSNKAYLAEIARARRMNDLFMTRMDSADMSAIRRRAGLVARGDGDGKTLGRPRGLHTAPVRHAALAEFEDSDLAAHGAPVRADQRADAMQDGAFPGMQGHEPDWMDEDLGDDEVDDDFDYPESEYYRRPSEHYVEPKRLGPDGRLSEEAKRSMNLLFHPDLYRAQVVYDEERDAFSTHHLRGRFTVTLQEGEIAVDAHLLSNPRIVDIDGNGDLDIILHVSYFFDPQEYASPLFNKKPLPTDVNPDNYAATAIVCMNLVTGETKWAHVLHLTTKNDVHPAYALSSPLIVNADKRDAALEVYVTSSTGSVVGVSNSGKRLQNWPQWMGPLSASPTAEDLWGNDTLSVCAGDVEGKVRCFSPDGRVVLEQNVIGGIADQINFGDVNGDGQMDLVFGTSAGLLYALDGRTGAVLPGFPVVTGGPIIAPVLLVNLRRGPLSLSGQQQSATYPTTPVRPPLTMVVPSHDGKVYLVHGRDGCIETIDIDEESSSMVLADDLTGNGKVDLLITTINGGVYAFETMSAYHPLKAWSAKTKGINGNSAGEGPIGVYITPDYRRPRDVRGDRFVLKIAIEDHRRDVVSRSYPVSVYVGSRTRVYQGTFTQPKEYLITVRTPLLRMYSSVTVVMTLPNGQVFTDTISLSFNMHFVSTIKFVLVIPFLITSAALMFVHKRHEVDMRE